MAAKKNEVAPANEEQFQVMGKQLTGQYGKAVGAMREILVFGAMMMRLREDLQKDSNVESFRGGPGRGHKGGGMKAWLKHYAPDVKEGTAYRFMSVAQAIEAEYQEVVGARIAKKFDLPTLVTTAPEKLPKMAAAKQLELFEFVSGTSQRSWLDRFSTDKESKPRGGKREGAGRKPLDPEEQAEFHRTHLHGVSKLLYEAILAEPTFIHLEPAKIDELDKLLLDCRRKIKEVRP